MKRLKLLSLMVIMYFCVPLTAFAEGRYQAVTLSDGAGIGPEKIALLDTVAGHLWLWIENPASSAAPGGRYLIYQGQLRPGSQMGEVVLKQEWGVPPANLPSSANKKR